MLRNRIGVLMGGMGAEKEVSIQTGEAVFRALTKRGHSVKKLYVDRDVDRVIRQERIDTAFIGLHGPYGEDGCVQGLLEILGIPYTGSGVLASALAMDKLKAKEMFRLHNVPTAPYYAVACEDIPLIEDLHGSFGYPAFVKPRRLGSSVGAGRADSPTHLRELVEEATRFDASVLVERFVEGREIAVGVLDGNALGAVEITPKGGVYDYATKYTKGQADYHLPPRLSATRYRGVLKVAERAARCLDVGGAVRVDLRVSDSDNEYVLEVNTLPGLTPTSLLPMIASAAGYTFGELCEQILQRARLWSNASPLPQKPVKPNLKTLTTRASQPAAPPAS